MPCLAVLAVTAAMIIDGDTIRTSGTNVRLTGEGGFPYDAPETWEPNCVAEKLMGEAASSALKLLVAQPGELCIIGRGVGGYGRDLGVLYTVSGDDVADRLEVLGLVKRSTNAGWCN